MFSAGDKCELGPAGDMKRLLGAGLSPPALMKQTQQLSGLLLLLSERSFDKLIIKPCSYSSDTSCISVSASSDVHICESVCSLIRDELKQ